jgi:hypothetical protein
VGIGWNLYSRLSKIAVGPGDPNRLTGEWDFESKSSGNPADIKIGKCRISKKQGILKLTGDWLDSQNNPAGNWESDMYKLDESKLTFFYTLKEIKQNDMEYCDGICTLIIGNKPVTKMNGIWVVVGKQNMNGSISLSRPLTQSTK